jgi:hypothetical protein
MKRVVVSAIQLLLVALGFAAFTSLTPWLGCRPLTELPLREASALVVPRNAQCFTNNHGRIAFHTHGLISREPGRFALHVAALVIVLGFLTVSVWWSAAQRKRGAANRV